MFWMTAPVRAVALATCGFIGLAAAPVAAAQSPCVVVGQTPAKADDDAKALHVLSEARRYLDETKNVIPAEFDLRRATNVLVSLYPLRRSSRCAEASILIEKINVAMNASFAATKANIEKLRASLSPANMRAEFAQAYESRLLSMGVDAHVRAGGDNNTTMFFKYAFASRPFVHQMVNDSDMLKNLAGQGFRLFEVTDGRSMTWRFRHDGKEWAVVN